MKNFLVCFFLVVSCLFTVGSVPRANVPEWAWVVAVTPPGETQVYLIPWAAVKAESGEWSFNHDATTVTVQKKCGEPMTGEVSWNPACRVGYVLWDSDYNSTQFAGIVQRTMCSDYPPPASTVTVQPVLCMPKADGTPVAPPCAYRSYQNR